MARRILGMGDIVTLVERAQQDFDEEEARKVSKKIAKNKFDFDDFMGQLKQIKKMGNMKDLLSMMPGMGKALRDVEIGDDAFKKVEAIMQSMTPYERANPDSLDGSRRKRLSAGSGNSIQEVNRFIKQFEDMKKMMRKMQGGGSAKMMRSMMKSRR